MDLEGRKIFRRKGGWRDNRGVSFPRDDNPTVRDKMVYEDPERK